MSNQQNADKRTIEQVRGAHEQEWLNIEGVEGVGIGLDDKSDREVLTIYVSQKTKAVQEQIPTQVDGYPVRLEVTGEFHAQAGDLPR